jgi:fucose 4-O-acetylase-like acetyltransferase
MPETEPLGTERPKRSIVIDVVRGIAIFLVAAGHTNQGEIRRGWWGPHATGLNLNAYIYSFHMPAFFFISGIFLCSSADKRGNKLFVVEKLRTLIYPYVVWMTINALTPFLLKRYTISKVPAFHTFFFSLITGSTEWFLITLFFAMMIAMLLRRVPLPLLFVLACGASQFAPATGVGFFDLGLKELPFLVLGMWVGTKFQRVEAVPRFAALGAAIVLGGVIAWLALGYFRLSHWVFIPLGVVGTLMLFLFARFLHHGLTARAVAWVGEGSLGVFLLSAYFQGGTRTELLRLGVHSAWVQLLVTSLAATVFPAWIYNNRERWHIEWLFVAPFGHLAGQKKAAKAG